MNILIISNFLYPTSWVAMDLHYSIPLASPVMQVMKKKLLKITVFHICMFTPDIFCFLF